MDPSVPIDVTHQRVCEEIPLKIPAGPWRAQFIKDNPQFTFHKRVDIEEAEFASEPYPQHDGHPMCPLRYEVEDLKMKEKIREFYTVNGDIIDDLYNRVLDELCWVDGSPVKTSWQWGKLSRILRLQRHGKTDEDREKGKKLQQMVYEVVDGLFHLNKREWDSIVDLAK